VLAGSSGDDGLDAAGWVDGAGAEVLVSGGVYEDSSLSDPVAVCPGTPPLPTELPWRTEEPPPEEAPVPPPWGVHPGEVGALAGGEGAAGAAGVEPPEGSTTVSPGGEPPDSSSAATAPAGATAATANIAAIIKSPR
jgi:hypothetical protein